MKFGLTDTELKLLFTKVIDPLKSAGCRVFIFGSRATGSHKTFSDVDLLFFPNPDTPIQGSSLFLIKEDIENSRFPFKVDLVNASDLATSYKDQILREKIEI